MTRPRLQLIVARFSKRLDADFHAFSRRVVLTVAGLLVCCSCAAAATAETGQSGIRAQVEADWALQEKRLGHKPGEPEAIRVAMKRAEQLLADRSQDPRSGQSSAIRSAQAAIEHFRSDIAAMDTLDADGRLALYHRLRWTARELALGNPAVTGQPLVFMKRHRFVCQMLHEYMGYFCDYGDVAGGGVFVLEEPGRSFKTRDLIAGRLPRGNYATLAMSYDGRRVYFAFAERAPKKPEFYSADRRGFHLYAVNTDGSGLRQLTDGCEDDFDPCPLPDGGIAFMSTRRGGFVRCNNAWEPIATYTLHRMNADGSQIRTLSWHETDEWHPWVLNDGRIAYTRWDYVDRSAANFHGIWTSYPDGSNPATLFGNYTMRINACYQPRAIPGSDRVMFVAGAHHADVGGSLVIVDPKRLKLDSKTGEDDFGSIETLTPEVCFAEANGWPKSYFHSPWPLSENYFLVAFSLDPLPGMNSGEKRDTHTGLYYFDRWGNLELLFRDAGASAMYPTPLARRARPPVLAGEIHAALGEEGEFFIHDVRLSHLPLPANRPVKELRVFQILPKTPPHTANQPRIGYANAESARMLLGTVPVEADGSAYFRAPARKPLYFQLVDDQGRAVQSMRSATYLQPGERRSCVGCHEGPGVVPPSTRPLAARRAPSRLLAGPDGSQPLSFPRLVQPVLDRHCVSCHDGSEGAGKRRLALTSEPTKLFTRAYDSLKDFVRWYEWGKASISQIATSPGHIGADESPLSRILADATHTPLHLPDADLRRLYLWLDANAPFYGAYDKDAQLAQREGKNVPPPWVQ